MVSIGTVIFYILIFLSVYAQVFFLITFLENRKKIIIRKGSIKLSKYPAVTVIVPSFNEEKTIYKTIRSLLALNYPKDKVNIFLIDDGSTDGTWNVIQKFSKNSQIKIFRKENGGKYTALNLGLEHVTTNFVCCLDSDSFADKESLIRIMSYFEKDPSIMAVVPSVVTHNIKSVVQGAQKAEYFMSVYFKKMLGFLGAIHVTPGPLTVFKKQVFDDLGQYRHAHNTEDMEIAYRMQKNHLKIEHCNDAYVYTNTPATVKKFYKQRLRWVYGFINNTLDYKNIIFRKKYGDFSTFTVPAGMLSVVATGYFLGRIAYHLFNFIFSKVLEFRTVGFSFPVKLNSLDFFFINTESFVFLSIIVYTLIIFSILLGKKMTEGKWGFSMDFIYFFIVFGLVAPFWLMKSIYNTAISRAPEWR